MKTKSPTNYWGILVLFASVVSTDVISSFVVLPSHQSHKTTTTKISHGQHDDSSKNDNNDILPSFCLGVNADDDYDMKATSAVEDSRRNILTRGFAATTLAVLSMPSLCVAANESKSLSEEYRQGTAALADMDDLAPVPREAYKKLPSGVVLADLVPGSGDSVIKKGSRVNMQWVLRKSNGYFVDSSKVAYDGVPFIFTVGDGTAIAGVDEGVQGMKAGSVRRLLIPPSLAFVNGLEDGKPGPLPVGFGPRQQMRRVQRKIDVPGEYLYFEVQVTRVRN